MHAQQMRSSIRSHKRSDEDALEVGWKRAKRWLTSPDPAYAQKNAAATG
jgi:hypothetical protein